MNQLTPRLNFYYLFCFLICSRHNDSKQFFDHFLLQEIVELVDYDYEIATQHPFEEFVILKEFYNSAWCSSEAHGPLIEFSKGNFQYKDNGELAFFIIHILDQDKLSSFILE